MMLLEEKKTTKLLDKEKTDTVSRPTLYMPVGKSGKTQIHVVLPAKTGDYPVQHTLELDPYTVLTSDDTRLAAIHEAHCRFSRMQWLWTCGVEWCGTPLLRFWPCGQRIVVVVLFLTLLC
jgi:hypothetical protein